MLAAKQLAAFFTTNPGSRLGLGSAASAASPGYTMRRCRATPSPGRYAKHERHACGIVDAVDSRPEPLSATGISGAGYRV